MDFSSSVNGRDSLHESNLKRITNARKRWRILARVLRRNSLESVNSSTSSIDVLSSSDTNPSENSSPQTSLEDSIDESPLSIRTFDGFNVVQQTPLPYQTSINLLGNGDDDWYLYHMQIKDKTYDINIHHINRLWTAQDLIGFNNTGNICVWPSEETLTVFVLEHILAYKNSWVLELGGGMTSLAGLMIAKYGNPYLVHLTDGNSLSVENVKRSLRLNDFNCFTKASMLKWENGKNRHESEREMYSLILCADCLFFDESREALVDTIEYYLALSKDAKALVMAPKRGQTLESFIEQAKNRQLNCRIVENYCESIWRKHLDLKRISQDYNEDIHYPLADYWKSNDRFFCDFCKCWLADNRSSKEFHENGKKHKINVQKRISEISRKAYKDAQNEKKAEADMRKMNEGAMKAYAGDLAAGSDYSSRVYNERAAAASAHGIGPQVDPFAIKLPEDDIERPLTKAEEEKAASLWCEARNDDGHAYYWNVKTGETTWEEPKEGFMAYKEYQKLQQDIEEKTKAQEAKFSKDFVENADEIAAAYNREKLKSYRKITRPEEQGSEEDDEEGKDGAGSSKKKKKKKKKGEVDEKYGWENPETAARPVGQWQTVEAPRPAAPVDLELPTRYEPVCFVPSQPEPAPVKKFKEKLITSIDADEPGFFKKRKLGGGNRNARKRVEDDD